LGQTKKSIRIWAIGLFDRVIAMALNRLKFTTTVTFSLLLMAIPLSAAQPSQSKINIADTNRILGYYIRGEKFEATAPDSAMLFYDSARKMAKDAGYVRGLGVYASYAIVVLNNQGKFRQALSLCQDALRYFEQAGTKRDMAVVYLNLGNEWQYLSDFQLAADNYLKAKVIAESLNDKNLQRIVNNNLASIFNNLEQFDKGKQYAVQSFEIAKSLKDDYAMASSLINMAAAEFNLKNFNQALTYYSQVEKIGQSTDDFILMMDGWLGRAEIYELNQKSNDAVALYEQVVKKAQKENMLEYEMFGWMGLSNVYLNYNQISLAEGAIENGIRLATSMGSKFELQNFYLKYSSLAEKQGNLSKALTYRKKYEVLKDSVIGEKSKSSIDLLEAKFESEKKAGQIVKLQAETEVQQLIIKQKNRFNYLLTSIIILLLFALLFLNYNQRQKLQQQRIRELENERQLAASQSVIKGQEEERSRLAKDLHDGLGGLLSGVKFSLSNMKSNVVLDANNALVFERSLDMLDHSISELRRVAHNMMPEVLVKFGLAEALKNYCDSIRQSQVFQIDFQSIGESQRFSSNIEIIAYRIVQELLNNSIKHAKATHVLVQLAIQPQDISITVEDNGTGFDISLVERAKGAGWSNIKSRVDFLKGKLDIQSSDNKGTSVHIALPTTT
jgi:two-component system, NarL family, sensor kinase